MQLKVTHRIEIGESTKSFIRELFGFCKPNNFDEILGEIMETQAQLVAKVEEIKAQMVSVGQQIQAASSAQLAKIEELQAQVAAGADTTAVSTALAELKVSTQAIDDLVDDLPVTIPPIEPVA